MDIIVFGVKAKIYLKYDGDLIPLGKILSKGLQIPDFWIKNDTEPPYTPTAMSEAFGFESWLQKTNNQKWNYEFEMSTMIITVNDQMHDISQWLKNYVINICKIEAKTEI